MDAVERENQLAQAVKRMREWQRFGHVMPGWVKPLTKEQSERVVDELIAEYFGDDLPDTQLEFPVDLLTFEGLTPPDREQPKPGPGFVHDGVWFPLPDLPTPPPPPARELPDLDELFRQWTPDEERKS